jgi:hypothetical protein
MNEVLMRVVVQAAAFFELCDEDVLDLDAAVKELESISTELQQLNPADKSAFIAFTQREAERVPNPEYRSFLLEFADAMGLRGGE